MYLSDDEAGRLAELARVEGRSQAEILRDAIAGYRSRGSRERSFAVARSGRAAEGAPIAQLSEEELLRGFGSS